MPPAGPPASGPKAASRFTRTSWRSNGSGRRDRPSRRPPRLGRGVRGRGGLAARSAPPVRRARLLRHRHDRAVRCPAGARRRPVAARGRNRGGAGHGPDRAGQDPEDRPLTARARLVLFAVAGLTLGALLVVAYNGLPAFGHYPGPYGDIITSAVVAERHATPAVGAIVFDYRGFDTLGEESILLAAAAGVGMLLRRQREEDEEDAPEDQSEGMRRPAPSDTVRFWGIALVAPLVVLGASLAAHGQLTPGGGF